MARAGRTRGVDDVERDYIAQEARETDSIRSVAIQDALQSHAELP